MVAVQLAGENRVSLVSVAADRDDSVDRLLQKFRERLRAVAGKSMPTSAMTLMASGWTNPAGFEPAL